MANFKAKKSLLLRHEAQLVPAVVEGVEEEQQLRVVQLVHDFDFTFNVPAVFALVADDKLCGVVNVVAVVDVFVVVAVTTPTLHDAPELAPVNIFCFFTFINYPIHFLQDKINCSVANLLPYRL